jgi:hypothetical protein
MRHDDNEKGVIMSLTINGNCTGAAAHGHDELADDFARPTDEVLKFIKAHCEPETYHLRFNEIYGRWRKTDYKRYTSELRAWRQEIADVLAERDTRKGEPMHVSTGLLDRTPTAAQLRAERQARAQVERQAQDAENQAILDWLEGWNKLYPGPLGESPTETRNQFTGF